jgi:integrase
MARVQHNTRLDTRTARLKLKPDKNPYIQIMEPGRALAYRRLDGKPGTWTARLGAKHDGKIKYSWGPLGTADDFSDADGAEVLTFAQAQAAARRWFDGAKVTSGKVVVPLTVAKAVADYRTDYIARSNKATDKLDVRLNRHILPVFGNRLVMDLNTAELTAWRNKLAMEPAKRRTPKLGNTTRSDNAKVAAARAESAPTIDPQEALRKRQASANRTLATFKAVLNFAFRTGEIDNDLAWRRVTPFEGVDQARIRALTDAESQRFVAACPPDFWAITVSVLLTAADWGELRTARVEGLDSATQTLMVSKKRGPHRIVLTDQALQHFTALANGKAPGDLLHVRSDGQPWGDSHQVRRMRQASEAANIFPAINFHVLRHTYATRAALNGTSIQDVGFQLGHKPGSPITARHYAHVFESDAAKSIRRSMGDLSFEVPPDEP